ncbi:DNA methyltransferase [Gabonibacter chumensis]|uniref:DNA methyltransferase n=1 Tax=Gabonibacter chumensis TaxID=2972474 RepID=UPI0025722825|nr:DNA methyltransferase [Gabonibacter chumensis]MCR9012264.1 DNA methyltransferase [Gabonibacter chumensis]
MSKLIGYADVVFDILRTKNKCLTDSGEVDVNALKRAVDEQEEWLISSLLENETCRKRFFIRCGAVYVFKQRDFGFFLEQDMLDHSYTKFENKIGLAIGRGKLLKDYGEVVLYFPFKDCVLEGGQSTEEGVDIYFEANADASDYVEKKAKRKEVFFNAVIGSEEIDRLLEPKAFENVRRNTGNGEKRFAGFQYDERGVIKDNLVIKGNNLLALYSLKERFLGKVRLIYIDPPYNTGNDSFGYNDNFNHSTWLAFMRNRLEVAKELLADDGSILVQLDWNEVHYMKILMDEVFGRENFRNEIIWCYNGPGSPKMKQLNRKHDNILWYSKTGNWIFNGDDVRMKSEVHVGGFNGEMNSDVSEGYTEKGKIPEDWWELFHTEEDFVEEMKRIFAEYKLNSDADWLKAAVAARIRVDGEKRTGYITEKPYKLMERLIKMTTNEGDIVLDFFAGSATTAYVADYLNRRYIAVEQLEETQEKIKTRLKNTEYVYIELARNNQRAIEKINACKNYDELLAFFEQMCERYFLDYNLKVREFRENVSREETFMVLPLWRQKEIFCKMLDLNQLYINYAELGDIRYTVKEEDVFAANEFYKR